MYLSCVSRKTQKRREKLRQKVKERIEYDRDEFDDMKGKQDVL